MTAVRTIVGREVAAYFHSPIAYVVGVAFLIGQGLAFFSLVELLSAAESTATYGVALRYTFGGTLTFWFLLFAVIATLTMRLIAEERQSGRWESLVTTGVAEGTIVVGKWLSAVVFVSVLWGSTLVYVAILVLWAPDGASVELLPIASAYIGVLLFSGALAAIGVLYSTLTKNQVVAGVATLTTALAVFLIGELGGYDPLTEGGDWSYWSLRTHMDAFARGLIDSRIIALYVSVTVVALCAATVFATWRRFSVSAQRRRFAALLFVAVAVIGANALVGRHPMNRDLTTGRLNSLASFSKGVLSELSESVELLFVEPGRMKNDGAVVEVKRVIERIRRAQPKVRVEYISQHDQSQRVAELAAAADIDPGFFRAYGGLILSSGGRYRVINFGEAVRFSAEDSESATISSFVAESAIVRGIAELGRLERDTLCISRGHGEVTEPFGAMADWLGREGFRIRQVALVSDVMAQCRVIAIVGASESVSAALALEISRFLSRGGGLLLALESATPSLAGGKFQKTGLESVLADFGLLLPPAIAVEPIAGNDGASNWRTVTGYSDHPIAEPLRRRWFSYWDRARLVETRPSPQVQAQSLVTAPQGAWGERDLASVLATPERGADDVPGPIHVAVASTKLDASGRVVVFGSARSLVADLSRPQAGNRSLLRNSIAWLARRSGVTSLTGQSVSPIRLVLSSGERVAVFILSVVVGPVFLLIIGAWVWWQRTRGQA